MKSSPAEAAATVICEHAVRLDDLEWLEWAVVLGREDPHPGLYFTGRVKDRKKGEVDHADPLGGSSQIHCRCSAMQKAPGGLYPWGLLHGPSNTGFEPAIRI